MKQSQYPRTSTFTNDDLVTIAHETGTSGVYETRNIKGSDFKSALATEGLSATVVAPAYDEEESYYIGDMCTFQGKLYKCISAVNPQKDAYIVGSTIYAYDWLSLESGGTPISQAQGTPDPINYKIATPGTSQTGKYFKWDSTIGIYYEVELGEEFNPAKWVETTLGDYALKSGAAVTITADDTTAPTDTSVLWVYPD